MNIDMVKLNPIERRRTYRFPDGDTLVFESVSAIEVRPSGTHRLEYGDNQKAFVAKHWLAIEIDTDAWTF